MDINNIPNNKKDAELFLNAQKLALLELAAEISSGKVLSTSSVDSYLWSEVEMIDLLLEGNE